MERILLVDNERALKAALATALRQDGYEVALADTAEQALELAGHTPFALVVTEARLRTMDGLDLFRRIRERQPQAAGLVATAYGSLPPAVEALRLGCADYLTKPFEIADLRQAIKRALAARRRAEGAASPFRTAAVPHELLAGPGEAKWVRDLWAIGPGRRGVLFAAEPAAGREVLRALVRAEASHRSRPRPVLASVAAWLDEGLDAFFGVVDVAGRVLRFAASGRVTARLCGAGFGTDVLTGRHDDIGVAIEPSDRLLVASAGAAPTDPSGSLEDAENLRAGACLRVDVGALVRGLAEETMTLQAPCSPDDIIERSEAVAGEAGLDEGDTFRVATAVCEAVANAARHAYEGRDGLIEVRYLQTPHDLLVEVRDTGRGFDLAATEPLTADAGDSERESGRGFLMMRGLMDAVEVDSAAGRGTTVRMEKGRAQC
ncbi:MAG: ATP-binding protein [bacterium]